MGRTATKTRSSEEIIIEDVPLPADKIAALQNKAAAHAAEIVEQFGDGLPYDRLRYLDKCRYHMVRSAEEALAVGRCLLVIKESEPHGEFLDCLNSLGLGERLAQRMMQATIKLANTSTSTHLIESVKSKSKLFELMVLDDDELQELGEGGTVAGLQLDDIDRMTAHELRAALREAKEDATAQGRLLSDKNSKIDELAAKLTKKKRHVEPVDPDAEGEEIRAEVSTLGFAAEAAIRGNLSEGFKKLAEHAEKSGANHAAFMAGLCAQIDTALTQLRGEFALPLEPANDFAWLRDAPPVEGEAQS